jgi:hypothetical protein
MPVPTTRGRSWPCGERGGRIEVGFAVEEPQTGAGGRPDGLLGEVGVDERHGVAGAQARDGQAAAEGRLSGVETADEHDHAARLGDPVDHRLI